MVCKLQKRRDVLFLKNGSTVEAAYFTCLLQFLRELNAVNPEDLSLSL